VGVRHALFPRSLTFGAQLHPSSVVGCQFPDATPTARTRCGPFRPRSEAGLRCRHRGHSGETSWPWAPPPAGGCPSDPGRKLLRIGASTPFCKRSASVLIGCRSLAFCHGSCLLPLKLHFPSQADDSLFGASRGSDLIVRPWSSPGSSDAFLAEHALRDGLFRFHIPAATPV
jgi:hypothetical protein